MRNISLRISNSIIRTLFGTAMASFIFVGASLAATPNMYGRKANHNVAHYTKVAGKDTGKGIARASRRTAKTLERGGGGVAHYTKVGGKGTGRFFRRVGHAIY